MPPLDLFLRLLLAAALGATIGLEREVRRKPAGLRTNMLIALGAALFTTLSLELTSAGGTPDRIAAQVVTGIGFVGAGAILRSGRSVHGMTTAATIWVNAAIGMAAGAGKYGIAAMATLVTLVVLAVLGPIERFFERRAGNGSRPTD
jgi:putative Mg2+ transporter-C (MgtC) family protein